jgi:putative endonuclease
MREYFVYILSSATRTLYIGVTNDLARRLYEHKHKLVPGFTSKYGVTRLVYYEATGNVHEALAREKQLKGWLRAKKIALIEAANPGWEDLSRGWYAGAPAPGEGEQETDSSLRSEWQRARSGTGLAHDEGDAGTGADADGFFATLRMTGGGAGGRNRMGRGEAVETDSSPGSEMTAGGEERSGL